MFLKAIFPAVIFATTIFHCEALAQDNLKNIWEVKMNIYDKDFAAITSLHTSDDGQKVTVLSPLGLEVLQASGGQRLSESPCVRTKSSKGFKPTFGSSSSKGITVGGGKSKNKASLADEIDALQKIVHIAIPEKNSVLRFNYGESKESISRIDLETGNEIWTTNELKWSLDDLNQVMGILAKATPGPRTAAILGVELVEYPSYYIRNMTKLLPDRDELLVDSFLGLACVDLSTGETKWKVEQTAKGLSHILFDEESNSLLTFGGNPAWLPTMPGMENLYQINKDILRVDMNSGDIIWQSSFNKNYRVKKGGGFKNEPVKPDIRLHNGLILTNFNQIEIFDFESGQALMETSTGKDAMMGFLGYGPATEFALPVLKDDVLYRSVITSVLAVGASVGGGQPNNHKITLEAYQVSSGELLWSSEEIVRRKINNMAVNNGLLLLSFDGSEGVKALNAQTGKEVWSFETSKRGITTKWELTDNQLIVVEKDIIHYLNQATGEVQQTIDAKKATGDIAAIHVRDGKLLAVGEKQGVAYYNLHDASVISEIKTGYQTEIHKYDDKVVIYPNDPTDPLMILDSKTLTVIGTVKKSGKRNAIHWCESTENVYEVNGNKVSALHFSWN